MLNKFSCASAFADPLNIRHFSGYWLCCGFILLAFPAQICGLTFAIPEHGNIVGKLQIAKVQHNESLGDIGRRFDVGVYEMIEANPNLDPWAPKVGARVIIPTRFVLPSEYNSGMVINLAEMRIYYYHRDGKFISTYPIGIGRKGWHTPVGGGKVIHKEKNPTWYPPESIKEAHAIAGDNLPDQVPPGPDNPLGKYALKLSIPGYLIHGTNRPGGIGVRSSSGCIRLFPEDVQALFNQVAINETVQIIHTPYKFGKLGKQVFIEAHQPLSEEYYQTNITIDALKAALKKAYSADTNIELDWEYALQIVNDAKGFPVWVPQLRN